MTGPLEPPMVPERGDPEAQGLAMHAEPPADSGDSPPNSRSRAQLLDWLERTVVLVAYAQMVYRLGATALETGSLNSLLLLPSEGLVVALILIRRPARECSTRWVDWCTALAGTLLPTMVIATGRAGFPALTGFAVFLTFVGLVVQIHAKLSLGRSLGLVAANRGICASGPYALVRHPMYLGYWLAQCAFLLAHRSLWNAVVLVASWVFQILRIEAEERLLARDPEYRDYQRRVPYRLLPGVL